MTLARESPGLSKVYALSVSLSFLLTLAAKSEAPIVPGELVQKAMAHSALPVIVHLAVETTPEGLLHADGSVQEQRRRIEAAQRRVITALTGHSHRLRHQYETVPFLALDASSGALAVLAGLKGVVARILEDTLAAPTLAESVPLVQGNAAWDAGYTGGGEVVAVLDTGVDNTHPFLSGKVVEEACYSANGNCPNGLTSQTGTGAAVPCTYTSVCFHGTHVAGIAAGLGNFAATFAPGGVAKGANLMAVQVFSRFTGADCGPGQDICALSYTSDQLAGLERVYAVRGAYAFASVNMSLGGGRSLSNCDSHPLKAAIDNLRSVGIATVIASGNDGFTDSISSPACISTAISVGSTDDGSLGTTVDAISSFSNSASFLSLLAPGIWINSSIPGSSSANHAGTSMATPHVAGAWAILKQARPSASVLTILTALQTTGLQIVDTRNGISKPRIRILEALQALPPPDTTLPLVTITTPTTDPTYSTGVTPIVLGGTASDNVGVTQVTCTNASTGVTVTAAGTTSWSCSVDLPSESNAISIQAYDAALNQGTDVITVTFTGSIGNDACAGAVAIPGFPYTNTQSTTTATEGGGEPSPTCGNLSNARSVWYRFTPPTSGVLTADTFGSNYDTILSTYTGSCAAPVAVAGGCNDDAGGVQSQVSFTVSAGTTHYFMVSSYTGTGGILVFNLSFSPADATPPLVTVTTPTSDPTHYADATPISVGGSASDNVGVVYLDCSNAASGITVAASGTTSWSCNVGLLPGSNAITVRAYDAANNQGTDVITVTYLTNSLAVYDSVLRAPKCGTIGTTCDSGSLLNGRDSIAGGSELNQPNTVSDSCLDGTLGTYHVDESIDRIQVSTLDGGTFAPGKMVRLDVTVWPFANTFGDDRLDLFYASNAMAPSWIYLATLIPSGPNAQVLSTTFALPAGVLQAARANFRFAGVTSLCSTGGFDDHDDLSFAVGAGAPANFYTISPCRLADTREQTGSRGGPALVAGTSRSFPVAGLCDVPSSAKAIAANITVVLPTDPGHLTVFPAGAQLPGASTINFRPGAVRANNAILSLGLSGEIAVFCGMGSGTTHFVLDVSGYFE